MNRYYKYSGLMISMFFLYSCGNAKTVEQNENGERQYSGVETKKPQVGYEPAFEGQFRAPAMETETPYQWEVIARKIGKPWAGKQLPDGRLLITDKSGVMKIFSENDGSLLQEIKGFPEVEDKGQGGMLDVVLDPDFEENNMIYWAFSEAYEDGNLTAIAKGKIAENEESIEQVQVIFRAVPAYDGDKHFGCRLVFDQEGYLFVSTGERSDAGIREQSQHLNSGLGKVFRISKDGQAAPGNPFMDKENAMPEIYSYGHRNPQGLAFHPGTGVLWLSEFGPLGGDEINIVEPGKNYGWPIITYGVEYSKKTIGEGITAQDGMEQPVYFWDPVVSPSGITFYESDEIPEWSNNLFVACLSGQHIIRLKIENNRIVAEERLLEGEGERFRDVFTGKNGELFAVTDSGKIYKISKK